MIQLVPYTFDLLMCYRFKFNFLIYVNLMNFLTGPIVNNNFNVKISCTLYELFQL